MTPTEYGAPEFALQLANGAATIIPWVGAGLGTAVLLLLTFLGIRHGIAFFQWVATGQRGGGVGSDGSGYWSNEDGQREDDWGADYDDLDSRDALGRLVK